MTEEFTPVGESADPSFARQVMGRLALVGAYAADALYVAGSAFTGRSDTSALSTYRVDKVKAKYGLSGSEHDDQNTL
jgi:hypothetical protein